MNKTGPIDRRLGRAPPIADSDRFQGFILGLVILNAACLGAEAIPALAEDYGSQLNWILLVSQIVFAIEIALRIAAHHPRVGRFFDDHWNLFDFVAVAASFVPASGGATVAARLLRLLRIFRIVTVSRTPHGAGRGHRAGARLGFLVTVALVGWYVFALAGFHLFGEQRPADWGTLTGALGSVARLGIVARASPLIADAFVQSPLSVLYFAVFYLVLAGLVVSGARWIAGASGAIEPGRRR